MAFRECQWSVLFGAERVLAGVIKDVGSRTHNGPVVWAAVQRHVGGLRLLREILTDLDEVRCASHPHWPIMLDDAK